MTNILTPEELTRYQRQISLDNIGVAGQIKLKAARVLCVGAGGLGSPLLLYLAGAGIGTLGIIDDEKIELSNLPRQILFAAADVGKSKVSVAKEKLLQLNPHLNIQIYPTRLTSVNAMEIIKDYDLVADCSDNFPTRYLINDTCLSLSKPFVFAAIAEYTGMGALLGVNRPCFRCLFPQIAAEKIKNCTLGGVLGVLPGFLGTWQAALVLRYFLGLEDEAAPALFMTNLLTLECKQLILSRDPACNCNDILMQTSTKIPVIQSMIKSITAAELAIKMSQEPNLQLLDVRTAHEHHLDNIGGINIPLQNLPLKMDELNKNIPLIIYCAHGPRSEVACDMLVSAGFSRVWYLHGGIAELRENYREWTK